jgi:hypothetical protein
LDDEEGEELEDPEVARMWTVAVVAEAFHVLPSVVARDLDEDPERLSLECLRLLNYAEARRALEAGEGDKPWWKDNKLMAAASRNAGELMSERRKRAAERRANGRR